MNAIKQKLSGIIHKANQLTRQVPWMRKMAVYGYHFVRRYFFGFIRKIQGYRIGFLTNGQRITPKGKHCYFGYYDKSVFSFDGSHYLFLMIPGKGKPKVGEKAKICYATSAENYQVLGETLAWNMQQGAMLRFIGDEWIAWNDYDPLTEQYVTRMYNVHTQNVRTLSVPLYDVSDDGCWGLTLDFERLNVDAEGYGYIQQQRKTFDANSSVRLVNLESGEIHECLTLEGITRLFPVPENKTFSYVNHLEFNPSGTRFIFIYRYVVEGDRVSRLFSCNRDGSDLRLLADDGLVSHCTWLDDTHITLWCSLNGRKNYYTIHDAPEAQAVPVGQGTPHEDGHPTYNDTRTWMVTDTYPDKAEYRHLIIYDVKRDQSRDIVRLYAPVMLHGPLRCDFHPRWHPNMKQVVIDSVHEGYRGLYLIDAQ